MLMRRLVEALGNAIPTPNRRMWQEICTDALVAAVDAGRAGPENWDVFGVSIQM